MHYKELAIGAGLILSNAANKEKTKMENEVKIPDYIQRMIEEKRELDEKIAKLIAFRYSEKGDELLDRNQRCLMDSQFDYMNRYRSVLCDRIYNEKIKAGIITPPSQDRPSNESCVCEASSRY